MSLLSLQGKQIWITGASSGIGRAAAIKANESGAFVVLVGRNENTLQETKQQLKYPEHSIIAQIDIIKFSEASKKVSSIVATIGQTHGVINAAGISTTLPFRNITPEMLENFFKVNVEGALLFTKNLIKPGIFSNEGGSIVFLTSVMAHVGESGKVLYSMSKGALLAAARSLALEVAARKIRINCISPGVVETPMTKAAYYNNNDEMRSKILAMHPLGLGQPEDVANACLYLLSDASRWMTGTQLVLDGGYTAR